MRYTPQVGHSVVASRKVKSTRYNNTIIGPITSVYENACRITTNEGTEIETEWQLFYSEWEFRFLHLTEN